MSSIDAVVVVVVVAAAAAAASSRAVVGGDAGADVAKAVLDGDDIEDDDEGEE